MCTLGDRFTGVTLFVRIERGLDSLEIGERDSFEERTDYLAIGEQFIIFNELEWFFSLGEALLIIVWRTFDFCSCSRSKEPRDSFLNSLFIPANYPTLSGGLGS